MTQQSGFGVYAGQPALITFNEREADLIRSITDEALRLKRNPELITADVASLSSGTSPALAGYLLRYIAYSWDLPRRGLAAELLLQMLGSPGIPAERRTSIAQFLVPDSAVLPPEKRTVVVQRFVELGGHENDNAARAGLAGLGMIASQAGTTLRPLTKSRAWKSTSSKKAR
jgi:hypothetical protein